MPVNRSLIRRRGDLKRALLAFAREPRFEHAVRQASEERFGAVVVGEEGELGNFLDYFADLVVLSGHAVAECMRAYGHFRGLGRKPQVL